MLNNYQEKSWELVFVDDGSTDQTNQVIQQVIDESQDMTIKCVSFDTNQGRGAALKAGFGVADGEIIITLDADLSYDENHIEKIIHTFDSHKLADIVVISPYQRGGVVKNVPFKRLLISKAANWILCSFFGQKFTAVTCVVRGYRYQAIKHMLLLEAGKEIHLEIIRKAILDNRTIIEIPGNLIWKNTKKARRKTNLKISDSARNHFLYALSMRPAVLLKYFVFALFILGIYEASVIAYVTSKYFVWENGLTTDLWLALKQSTAHSPHTIIISLGCFIMGIQLASFCLILITSKIQHEEQLKHILAIHDKKNHIT